MLIDFHTHTLASDGALSPDELLTRAHERGVRMLAITDHDTVNGYLSVHEQVRDGSPTLVPGVELSCCWSGVTVHIVGLGMDCEHPAMVEGLGIMDAARKQRGVKISERLAKHGFIGALEGALAEAGESQLGRPHFAAWMIAQGHVADFNAAFDRYLGQGKTGDVKAFWPPLADVVKWITSAGGVAVVAHPYKYRMTGMKLRRLLVDFVAAGGEAIEVLSGRQTSEQRYQLERYAREFGLEISVGSDFHRDMTHGPDIGVESPRSNDLRGVWERW